MKIEALSGKRYEVALGGFLEEKTSLCYKGIVFREQKKMLHVYSYSDYPTQKTTEKMGLEKIQFSKVVLKELLDSVPEIRNSVANLQTVYIFCCDYQTGAEILAKEKNNKYKWLK